MLQPFGFKGHFIAILSISLLLGSCYNDRSFLGNNLLPMDDIYQVRIDSSFTISAYTLAQDSLNSQLASEGVLGYLNSDIFGSTKASFIGRFYTTSSTEGFGGPTSAPDSLIFYFTANSFNGDSSKVLNIRVHELTDTAVVNNENALKPIEGHYNPNPFFTTSLTGKGVIKQYLSLDFARSLMDSAALADYSVFFNKFKGFYITCDDLPGYGGLAYNFSVSKMYIRLYYHYTTKINDKDSTINQYKTYNFLASRYFQYLQDPSKADPAKKIQHLNDTIVQDSVFYVQNLGGVYGKLKIDNLSQWLDSMPLIVHRAELIIPKDDPVTATPDSTISQLLLYYKSGDTWGGYIRDYITNNLLNSNGSYRKFANDYKVDITYHFQKILKGEFSDNNIYVFPNTGSTSLKQNVLRSGNNSKPIRLIITYTKLK